MIGVLTSHKTSSHGALTHDVRKTQRLAVYVFRPDHRACLGIVAGRALSGLPVKPTPQLRGPRSTTSPRSRPGKLVELDAFGVPSSPCRPRRCHSQKRGALLRPSGSVIAAGCRSTGDTAGSEGVSSGETEKTSASEEIFERHGWNKVKSGWSGLGF